MVKIRFLGACHEVGRSGILLESEDSGDQILLDYGIKSDHKTLFPEHVSGKDLSAIVLSHSHIDHCGGLPTFYISGSVPLFCTELTFRVTDILLGDMMRISKEYLPFGKKEVRKMHRFAHFLPYRIRQKVGRNSFITLFNAGHIPGSAMVLVEMDGKKILYTGDFNITQTQLLNGADPMEIPPLDALIMESTYGTTNHADRIGNEEQLLREILNAHSNEGITLIPAFGVSRSQEIMMILTTQQKTHFSITMDGMARAISQLYMRFPKMLRDFGKYKEAIKKTHFISQRNKRQERNRAASTSGVIIAPSGMLKGGTVRFYAENLIDDERNAIILVSYQVEGTPGSILLETGKYLLNEGEDPVDLKAQVIHLDFSSHAGMDQMVDFVQNLKFTGEKRVYCVHGDEEVITSFTQNLRSKDIKAECPYIGQKVTF